MATRGPTRSDLTGNACAGYCAAAILGSHAGAACGIPGREETMQATTAITTQRGKSDAARARVIVRFNGLMFHSLAAASFLESAVALQVESLNPVLARHPEARLWLEQVWLPQRAELGRRLREYVEATWPEFDWNTAYEEFQQPRVARARTERRHNGAALEVMARCAVEAQYALFYRGLAKAADEASLRDLAGEAAAAHAMFFDFFRGVFESCKRQERVRIGASWKTLRLAMRTARDVHLQAAFEPLAQNWNGPRTVPELTYGEFVQRMVRFVLRHAPLGHIEQLLFRPWLAVERPAPAPAPAAPVRPPRPAPLGLQPA